MTRRSPAWADKKVELLKGRDESKTTVLKKQEAGLGYRKDKEDGWKGEEEGVLVSEGW